MIPRSSVLSGADVAICALIHFYVSEESYNQPGPLLTRFLAFTTRLIFQVDPACVSLRHFLQSLEAFLRGGSDKTGPDNDEEAAIRAMLIDVKLSIESASSFSGLHNYFTRIERLLLREEMYDDLQNITIAPAERQIDESSPFGHFLHQCLETYLALEDDDFVKVVRRVQEWAQAGQSSERGPAQGAAAADASSHDVLLADESIMHAIRRGDYARARAELEGSFDRAPAAILGRTLPETLLHNAIFHLKTLAYETAKASLEEALRLARGSNDIECIAACDDLLRQIAHEELNAQPRAQLARTSASSQAEASFSSLSSLRLTHKRDANRHIDDGTPLLHVIKAVEHLESNVRKEADGFKLTITKGSGEGGLDLAGMCEYDLMLAGMWREIGSKRNATVLQHTCADSASLTTGWGARETMLALAVSRSSIASLQGRHCEAISLLMDDDLVMQMEIGMLHTWHAAVMRTAYRAARQSDAQATMRSIESLRPEVLREVGGGGFDGKDAQHEHRQVTAIRHSEATFGRSVRQSEAEVLRAKLDEVRRIRRLARDAAQAMTMAIEVREDAQRMHLYNTYRRATCEAAEALLSLGQTKRAKSLLDEIMPQVLASSEAELRARISWAYSRVLLAAPEEGEETTASALLWLDRAARDWRLASMWPELAETMYVRARLFDHLGDIEERDKAARAYNDTQDEHERIIDVPLPILKRIQRIASLASAHVVAGG